MARSKQTQPADEGGLSPGPHARTRTVLAMIYGCSTAHIDRQIQAGAPKASEDGYDLLNWGLWWKEQGRFRRLSGKEGVTEGEDGENWRRRKDRADALLAEQKLADLMELYCRRDEVDRAAARDFTTLRLLLDTVPDRCTALVPADCQAEIQGAVQDSITTALQTMRQALSRWSGDADPGPVVDALEFIHRDLGRLPRQTAKVVRGEKQKAAVAKAVQIAIRGLREKLAAAMAIQKTEQRARE